MDHKLFIANRGEIAIRIARTAFELEIPTVGIFAEDDQDALHLKRVDEAFALQGVGAKAYLDGNQLIEIALSSSCTMLHPGYGFLSEDPVFAKACTEAGLIFVGPDPQTIQLFGKKTASRNLAVQVGVPVVPGTENNISLEEAGKFLNSLPKDSPIAIKATAGGGGRGMRVVHKESELKQAFKACKEEARKAFGNSELYAEQYLDRVHHVEVQVFGNGKQHLSFGTRACSFQRRHQKLIEITPCPGISPLLEEKLTEAAMKMAREVELKSLCTFEFLVEGEELNEHAPFYFLEANPRIQVEHTITEARYGIDLVALQLGEAMGLSFEAHHIKQEVVFPITDWAIQFRINAETYSDSGAPIAASGKIEQLTWPLNKDVRIDTHAYQGLEVRSNYDPLLAKIIISGEGNQKAMIRKAYRVLLETLITGVDTNIGLFLNLLKLPELNDFQIHTSFFDRHLRSLLDKSKTHPKLVYSPSKGIVNTPEKSEPQAPQGLEVIKSPLSGTVVDVLFKEANTIRKGQALLIVEAMKMESLVEATNHGLIEKIFIRKGDLIHKDQVIAWLNPSSMPVETVVEEEELDPGHMRADLQELITRKAFLKDEQRPEAVAKRRKTAQRTARENIADLCDEDSFREYGGLAVAAQRKRRSMEDLIKKTPADGLVTGIGTINASSFEASKTSALVMAYDYTVLAGTQGTLNHKKMDRMSQLAAKWAYPIVLFAEGGGGRPGDVDFPIIAGLDVSTFSLFASLSGKQPRIAIVSRYCFAGNAALAGCADVLIATENSSIGMGGPAMIEGGGLGKYHPAEVGPAAFQTRNGVIDILVKDEAEAVTKAKQYLGFFQGRLKKWNCESPQMLRQLIPENRRRVYNIRRVIETLCDDSGFLELRNAFGKSIITGFSRIEGHSFGIVANDPAHLGGAINSDGADKMARFLQLCDAFGIPILALVDTPGIMVGPKAEKSGTVRHASRLFTIGASLTVPYFSVVLRKGYGLGAMAMTAGSFHGSVSTVAWPTGEFGAMGLEGAVRLGFRKEIEEAGDEAAQQKLYDELVAKMYERGKGINLASYLEIDDVIDPADTRSWIVAGLEAIPPEKYQKGSRRTIDNW